MKMASATSEHHQVKQVTFDEALTATNFGKFNYFIIVLSGFMLINVILESLGISFIIPVSECDLNLNVPEKGVLSAISFVGIIISSHFWGFLADTIGRRQIIRPTLLIAFVITVISSFATNFYILVTLRFLNGIFIAAESAIVYVYLGEFHTNTIRTRAIMSASFICAFTAILFPVSAWLVINQDWSFHIPFLAITYKPWRLYMIVNGVPGLFVALCLFKIPESPKFVLSTGNTIETIKILQKIYAINTGRPQHEYPIIGILPEVENVNNCDIEQTSASASPSPSASRKTSYALFALMWQQTAPLFAIEHIRTTALICFLQFCSFVNAHGMYIWFPEILNIVMKFIDAHPNHQYYTICEILAMDQANRNDQITSIIPNDNFTVSHSYQHQYQMERVCIEKLEISTYGHTIVLELLYITFFLLMGTAMKVLGRISVLFLIMVGCGVCGVISVPVKIPMVAVYLFVVQLLCGLGVTVVSAITIDLYPTNLRGMAVCISLMVGRIGSVVGSNVAAILLASKCELAFYASAGSLILSGFLGFLLPKPKEENNNQLEC